MDEYIHSYSTGSGGLIKPGDIVRRLGIESEWFVYAVDGEYDTPTGAMPKAYICANEIEFIWNSRQEGGGVGIAVDTDTITLIRRPNYQLYRTGEQPMVGDEVVGRNGLNTYVVSIRVQNNAVILEVMIGMMDDTVEIMVHMVDFVSRGVNEDIDFDQEETDFLENLVADAYALNPPTITDRHRTISGTGVVDDEGNHPLVDMFDEELPHELNGDEDDGTGSPMYSTGGETEEEEEEEPTPLERGSDYTIDQLRYSTSNRIPMTNIRGDIKYILDKGSNKYYKCPVTGGPAYKPVQCIPCGHVYSYMGLRQWLTQEKLNREYGYENASGDPLNNVCTICQQPIRSIHVMTLKDIELFAKKESIEIIQTEISELRNKCSGYTKKIKEMEDVERELKQEDSGADEGADEEKVSENNDVPKRAQVLKELKF